MAQQHLALELRDFILFMISSPVSFIFLLTYWPNSIHPGFEVPPALPSSLLPLVFAYVLVSSCSSHLAFLSPPFCLITLIHPLGFSLGIACSLTCTRSSEALLQPLFQCLSHTL